MICPLCQNRGWHSRAVGYLFGGGEIILELPCRYGCKPPHGRWSSEPGALVQHYFEAEASRAR